MSRKDVERVQRILYCELATTHSFADTIAIGRAIGTLEKQIPEKPKGDYHSVPHHRCPCCNSAIRLYEDDPYDAFCKFCGQAIDWSDYA